MISDTDAKLSFREFVDKLSREDKINIFNSIIYNDQIGVNITDSKGQTVFLNDAHTRITGQPKELYINNNMYKLEELGVVTPSAAIKVIASGDKVTLRQATPHNHNYEVSAFPVFDGEGKLCYVINLLSDITEAINYQKRVNELEEYSNILKQAITGDGHLIYQSYIMQQVVEKSRRVAETDASVLITGPSGVGKELIADIIHENSLRKDKPFIKINCAAIPENLLESELFGYEPGAFTGGSPKGKKGLIESANGGTLLLDEIGELPLALQSKLLRVLQERSLRRLGGNKAINVDFRLISSTNVDLKEMIASKEFREDLYYRLNVIYINVPPLENRREDIPLLINHFIRLFNAKYELNKSIDSDAMQFLSQYDYPGNVRELRNVVERIVIQSSGERISLRDAYESLGVMMHENAEQGSPTLVNNEGLSLKQIMENYEKNLLEEYIRIYKNGTELSKQLKTDQSTISRKLTKYGIKY